MLLYFTSGTTALPKLVEHTHTSYPVGHLATMYWMGLQPGDVHLNISSPGWAKHAWSNLFAPWLAGATVLVYNYARFDAAALLTVLERTGVTTFCAPPTVWRMLDPGRPRLGPDRHPRVPVRRRAAEPRGDRAGPGGLGRHHPRRLRPDRDQRPGGQHPGAAGQAGLDGPAAAGLHRGPGRPGHRAAAGHRGRALPGARAEPAAAADDRLQGALRRLRRREERRGVRRRRLPHRRRRAPRRRRLPDLRRPVRRRVQGQRLPDQPVRAGVGPDRAPGGRRGRGGAGAGRRSDSRCPRRTWC